MPGKKIFNFLPFWCKLLGGALMGIGMITSFYFIYLSVKPEWLQFNVFTFYSKYVDTTALAFIYNNQGDEIAIICYLVGFILFMLSRSKIQPDLDYMYKTQAAVYMLLIVAFLLMVSYLFVHGMAIVYTLILFIYFIPVIYLIIYSFLKIRARIGLRNRGLSSY